MPAREDADRWEAEYRNRLLKRATDEIRGEFSERAWKCFYLSAIEATPVDEIAARLGMTPGAVYTTKSRAIARLRERVREIEGDWQ
jgi:RNA polymerase sigma factor (sigma-70 family)